MPTHETPVGNGNHWQVHEVLAKTAKKTRRSQRLFYLRQCTAAGRCSDCSLKNLTLFAILLCALRKPVFTHGWLVSAAQRYGGRTATIHHYLGPNTLYFIKMLYVIN